MMQSLQSPSYRTGGKGVQCTEPLCEVGPQRYKNEYFDTHDGQSKNDHLISNIYTLYQNTNHIYCRPLKRTSGWADTAICRAFRSIAKTEILYQFWH